MLVNDQGVPKVNYTIDLKYKMFSDIKNEGNNQSKTISVMKTYGEFKGFYMYIKMSDLRFEN